MLCVFQNRFSLGDNNGDGGFPQAVSTLGHPEKHQFLGEDKDWRTAFKELIL